MQSHLVLQRECTNNLTTPTNNEKPSSTNARWCMNAGAVIVIVVLSKTNVGRGGALREKSPRESTSKALNQGFKNPASFARF